MENQNKGIFSQDVGFVILILQITSIFAYGFSGVYYYPPSNTVDLISTTTSANITNTSLSQNDQKQFVLMSSILTLMGFGCLLSMWDIKRAIIITLIIFGFSVQIGPLLFKLWYQVFFYDSSGDYQSSDRPFHVYHKGQHVQPGLFFMQIVFKMVMSLLLALTELIHMIDLSSMLITTMIFNITWSLSFYLNAWLFDNDNLLFDGYGTATVYIFGCSFGITSFIILFKIAPKIIFQKPKTSVNSIIMGVIGALTIFGFLPAIGSQLPSSFPNSSIQSKQFANYSNYANFDRYGAPINVYLCLIVSVILGTMFSSTGNQGKISIREIFANILGAIALSSSQAMINYNIIFPIIGGFIVATVTRITFYFFQHRFLISIVINALIGGLIISPGIFAIIANNSSFFFSSFPPKFDPIITTDHIFKTLSFSGISMGIGTICGIICGNIIKFRSGKWDISQNDIQIDRNVTQ